MTLLIRSLHHLKAQHQGAVLTIGNFDGVHLGHRRLLAKVIEKAESLNAPSMIMTFEPHPIEFFANHHGPKRTPRLSRLREKFTALAESDINYVLILPFNQYVASMSASDFVNQILHRSLQISHLVIGDDFRFGTGRQGDATLLQQLGAQLGFSVESIATECIQHERVSSSRIRKALLEGNHQLVKHLLGRPYTMQGRVSYGHQRGRLLGFPTANIYLHRQLTPLSGVYTVYVHGIEKKPLPGVANIGVRPTVDGTRSLLEVHLLNFTQDIYGRYVEVEFCQKLRDEIRYPNLDLLKIQIAKDVNLAQIYFKKDGML